MTSMERISGAEFVKSLAALHIENNPQLEGDYFDEDGLLRCGTCRQLKRSRIEVSGEEIIVPVWCECRKKAAEVEKKQTAAALAASRQWELRKLSLMDSALSEVRFSAADERENSASIGMCRRYADLFPQMKRENRGLLLFGSVGTGKTFTAACIANALLEQGVPVLMTNFSRILNALSGLYSEEKNQYIDSLNQYSLLIIDDLGIERSTEFALEQVFNVIDSRYRSKLPLIVTTNMTLEELKNPQDLTRSRIYDRVLERCVPLRINNQNIRQRNAAESMKEARRILAGGTEI